jgi:hypothetical protein
MKARLLILFLLYLFLACNKEKEKETIVLSSKPATPLHPQSPFCNGDIIFQALPTEQCEAIKLATHSRFSHCGMIWEINHIYFVYEAVGPVVYTPLNEWISDGVDSAYAVKRVKFANKYRTAEMEQKMKDMMDSFLGVKYDMKFEPSDEKMYCSEIVWKLYRRITGLSLGDLHPMGSYDLRNVAVMTEARDRWGKNLPLQQLVIAPQDIYDSDLLETVWE